MQFEISSFESQKQKIFEEKFSAQWIPRSELHKKQDITKKTKYGCKYSQLQPQKSQSSWHYKRQLKQHEW